MARLEDIQAFMRVVEAGSTHRHEPDVEVAGDIDVDHPGGVTGIRHVDTGERPVGDVGSHRDHPQRFTHVDVSEVVAGTGDEARVLGPFHRCSQDGSTHGDEGNCHRPALRSSQ